MAGSLFDTFGVEEKQRIRDVTDTLVELLEEWSRRYPSVRTTRTAAVALLSATVAPQMPITASLSTSKFAQWLFGVDDRADERLVSLAEFQQKTEQWRSIANDGPSSEIDGNDELSIMLLEIREELSKYPLFEPLREWWSSEVARLVEAMVQEYWNGVRYRANGSAALPSLDEYVNCGLYSIGVTPWAIAMLIVLDDPSVEEHLDLIGEAIKNASAAVRLYNDLRSYDKEVRKENTINSITITYRAILGENPNATEEVLSEANRHVLQLADSYAQNCYNLFKQFQTESGQFEQTISRMVAFHRYFYREIGDYHTTSQDKAHEMLGA
jgi:hypothetical protein